MLHSNVLSTWSLTLVNAVWSSAVVRDFDASLCSSLLLHTTENMTVPFEVLVAAMTPVTTFSQVLSTPGRSHIVLLGQDIGTLSFKFHFFCFIV
jgi:hypothetical protein